MKREEIIRMAREAGAANLHGGDHALFGDDALERFAALVAAAERKKVRASMKRALRRHAAWIRADERESIAMMVEDMPGCSQYFYHVVEAIRARGEQK